MLFGKAARKAVKADAIQASECRKLINITKIPTMTVPFDTDVLLFLVSATSPSGHTQPMEVHAHVFVECGIRLVGPRCHRVRPAKERKAHSVAWPAARGD